MDLFVTSESAEFVQPGFHIVVRDLLTRSDRGQVHLVHDGLVVANDLVVDFETKVPLSLKNRDPKLALKDHPRLERPKFDHWLTGIPGSKNVVHGISPRLAGGHLLPVSSQSFGERLVAHREDLYS
jgi:hypothetical protein